MRNAIESMLRVVHGAEGIAVVWCPDLDRRDWLVRLLEDRFPDARVTLDVEAALARPTQLMLLLPRDEREVILTLDGGTDQLLQSPRSNPIVLFLMRNGDGQRCLASEAPNLRSWIGGNAVDPEALAEIDVPKERATFEHRNGATPEAWLVRWRSGELPETSSNFRIAHDAVLL